MAHLARKPVRRQAPSRPEETKAARRAAPAARKPAWLQARLAVSQPQDAEERQADQVAADVSRTPRAVQRASLEPGITPEKREESLAPKPVPSAARIARAAAADASGPPPGLETPPPAIQTRLWRQPGLGAVQQTPSPDELTAEGQGVAGRTLGGETEARIEALRGQGEPLPEEVLTDMQARFGRDFSAVRIHTGSEAAALCAEVEARAFTVGSDIFFASGQYAPHTEVGRELLAHELTHVVQQTGGAMRLMRRIDPMPEPEPEPGSAGRRALDRLSRLEIPPIKQRHLPLYNAWAAAGNLKRLRGYSRGRPAQTEVWRREVQVDTAALEQKLQQRNVPLPPTPAGRVSFQVGPTKISDTRANLMDRLKIPNWDRRGRPTNFQVDHIVELQVSGEHGEGLGNSVENMELLDQPANASSGSTIMNTIYSKVNDYLATLPAPPSRESWLRSHDIIFDSVGVGGGRSDVGSAWWSRADIQQAEPVAAAEPLPDRPLQGTADCFVLASAPDGIEIARFRHPASPLPQSFPPGGPAQAGRVAGLILQSISLNESSANAEAGMQIGSVNANWDMPPRFRSESGQINIPILAVGPYAGYLGALPALSAHFEPMSLLQFQQVGLRDTGLYAVGHIQPSLPLLADTPIEVILNGRDISFRVDFSPANLSLPVPGVQVDDAMLTLAYNAADGFAAMGSLYFSVSHLGSGCLTAGVSQDGGLQAGGSFDFDPRLFDRARIEVWYRNEQFGAEGEIGIDRPDKIRGIRSANVRVRYEAGAFSASGSVQPAIPGVQEAGLNVAYSEEQGLTMGGTLQLAEIPGIRSGSIEVTVNKRDEVWRVCATGEAQPAIPGIDSSLRVTYEDGAFTAEVSGTFRRGMLSGQVTAGVTNRPVDENGQPAGEPTPDAPLVVYGGGSATVQIAPWLQGTTGVRFAPNGEVTVTGEIALPSQIELFPRKEIRRELFSIDFPIPIVPGIFAEVGGGLDAHAGIGPGVIDQLRVGIEYNPAHEEQTHVTGDGHVNVPADAGLRLAVHGGIGLGIPAASVSGGLEVGGELGLAGAAEAGVHVDWRPSQGLAIDAYGRLSAHPRFVFDVSGYVEVEALFFTIYENRWRLASFEYGSDLTFGVTFPIHYREGEPFDISLEDVQFQVPEVSPRQILGDLVERIV